MSPASFQGNLNKNTGLSLMNNLRTCYLDTGVSTYYLVKM